MTKLTATEVARNFSEVLNRVATGEEIEIVRNGATVALLAPPRRRFLTREAFAELMDSAPSVDDAFASEMLRVRAESGAPESHWAS